MSSTPDFVPSCRMGPDCSSHPIGGRSRPMGWPALASAEGPRQLASARLEIRERLATERAQRVLCTRRSRPDSPDERDFIWFLVDYSASNYTQVIDVAASNPPARSFLCSLANLMLTLFDSQPASLIVISFEANSSISAANLPAANQIPSLQLCVCENSQK